MRIVTIADAVAVMSYLHSRALLCSECGTKAAKWRRQFNKTFCHDCRTPHGTYEPYKEANELEGRIIGALQDWVAANSAPNAGGSYDSRAEDSSSQ